MRKIMATLLVAAVFLIPVSISEECDAAYRQSYDVYDGGVYDFSTDGTGSDSSPYKATLYGYTMGDSDCVFVQSALDGYPLLTIASGAFQGSSIKNVVVPDSVTTIESGAFSTTSLEGVYFLGDMPFMATDAFPSGITVYSIPGTSGWGGFSGYVHEYIDVMEHTSEDGSIVKVAFLPGEVAVYGGSASSNGDLTIPSTVRVDSRDIPVDSIAQKAFYSHVDIINVIVENGISIIRDRAFYNPLYEKGDNIRSMILPDSLKIVLDEAFRQQHSLGNINLKNVEYMGFESLRMCYAMTSIDVSAATTLKAGALYCCEGAKTIRLNPTLEAIPDRALGYCRVLESIEIPSSVESLGHSAFYNTQALVSITIPESVKNIGESCFYGSKLLETVVFGHSLESIGDSAFHSCSNLKAIALPDSLTDVGNDVFRGCTSLNSIVFGEGLEYTGKSMFLNCNSLESIIIPGTMKTLGDGSFKACKSLSGITLVNGVETIGKEAFMLCGSLTEVTLPHSVKVVSDGAFVDCISLTSISMGSSLQKLGNGVFSGCTSLADVYLDGSNSQMDEGAIPEGVIIHIDSKSRESSDSSDETGFDTGILATVAVLVVISGMVAFFILKRRN